MEMDKEKLSISQKISILNERQIAFQDQQKRFFSHIESEQRHFKTQSDLIARIEHNMTLQNRLLEKDIQTNKDTLKELKQLFLKHEQILINGGRGLVFDVDRLKQYNANNKEGRTQMIAILAVAVSIVGVLVAYFH